MDQNDDCDSDPLKTYAYGLSNLFHVGDEYQTKIPSLITESEYLDYVKDPYFEEEERKAGAPIEFLIGLDIPIAWINQENTKKGNDNVVVPGCGFESWSEVEKGNFVLGLYIFRKDFVRLNRFIESKKMGDIVSYYYGKFYRSDEYIRWSECKKRRGKRRVLGKRIFSGVRQQELLSRLVPHVSQECQNGLFEVSRAFGDARISLEQYVSSIKTLTGIKLLIDAVAIGKGKQDLTGSAIEPTKQNQAIQIRPEIPTGEACSSLTSEQIIQFLTGNFRLSKARSNDIFWEAVWPKLLARGWHSEQPNGYNYSANGKNPLVFLVPGVKKFSRKLVKGDTYLDSVTDVLNKVALNPKLLELDNEENGDNETKLEDGKEEEEDVFVGKRKSCCYLQPRGPSLNRGKVVVKFAVVDTSLRGGKIFTVRELDTRKLSLRSCFDESHSDLVYSDVSDGENMFLANQEMIFNGQKHAKKQKTSDERKNLERKHVIKTANGSDSVVKKAKLSRKPSEDDSGRHAKKPRGITACTRVDSKVGSSLDSHVGSSSQLTSRCSSIDTVDEQNQPQPMNLIDLNVTPESEEVKDERNEPVPPRQSENIVGPKEQEDGGSRRHSTRNRPPTARALEAIANGFLTVHSRKKRGKEESKSRNSQNTPGGGEVAGISECSTGDASSAVKGDDENGEIEK